MYKLTNPLVIDNGRGVRVFHYAIRPVIICPAASNPSETVVTVQLADGGYQYTYLSNLENREIK